MARRRGDGLLQRHGVAPEVIEGLVHQEDGVVDDDADEDDEAEKCQHVELLRHELVEDHQPADAAGGGQRHRQQDDQRIDEALEQHRHHQIDDGDGDQQVHQHVVPGLDQLVRGARHAQPDTGRQALGAQFVHDLGAHDLHGRLQRQVERRADAQIDGAFLLDVPDLGRARGHHHLGQGTHRQDLARTGHHRQVVDALGLQDLALGSAQHEVDAFAVDGDLADPEAVVEGVDGHAQFAGGDAVVGEEHGIGNDAHLRRPQFQARPRPQLVARVARQGLVDELRGPQRHVDDLLQVGARDVEIDGAAAADAASEQRRLVDEAVGAGLAEERLLDERDQFGRPLRLARHGADEGLRVARDEEEVLDLRRFAVFRFGTGLRGPLGPHGILDLAGDGVGRGQVVSRRRQGAADDEVAVALGQVLQLGQEQVGGQPCNPADHRHHRHGDGPAARHQAGEGDGCLDEGPRQVVDPGQAPMAGAGRRLGQEPVGERRNHRHRDDQRQGHGHRDGHGDVAEELADFQLHHQHRGEHGDRGEGRHQDRAPHLLGALEGGLAHRMPRLAQAVDVLQHDDGGIHHHADGEGDAGQGDDVDGPPHGRHGDERSDHRDRDGHADDQGRRARAQEQQQHQRRQGAADEDVLLHQVDGGIDVDGLVVDLGQLEAGVGKHRLVELGHRLAYAPHGLDDVGAGIALGVEGEPRLAEIAHGRRRLGVGNADLGDVAHGDPRHASGGRIGDAAQHHRAHLLGRRELALGTHHVAALAFLHGAGGDRGAGVAQDLDHLRHGEAVAGHLLGEHGDHHLAHAAGPDVDLGDAGDPLQAVLHHVLDEIAVGMNGAVVAGQTAEAEVCDGPVVAAGGVEGRFVDLGRIAADPVQTVGDQQQRLVHILVDAEFQGHPGAPVARAAAHLFQALQPAHHLLLAVDDLALDLGRGGAGPVGADGDHRAAHVGGELDGDRCEGQQPEQNDHHDRSHDGHGPLDGQPDQVHPPGLS